MNGQNGRRQRSAKMDFVSGNDVVERVLEVVAILAWIVKKNVRNVRRQKITMRPVWWGNPVLKLRRTIDLQIGVPGPYVHKLAELEAASEQEDVGAKESLATVEMKN